jgi:succinyl-CoA synthetase beta subunit
MDLLEYQVKEWFGQMGIPVLPSQRIDHPTDLKRLKIRYPIVLKSQVHAVERAKVGGVRIVETTIDAIAAAQNIFNLPIWGELPEVLLAESKYDAKEEFYLAVVLDTALCRPVLLGCKDPDLDGDSVEEKMQHVVVDQEFSPFYARRLTLKMGLQGELIQSVSDVVEKMYQLFIQKDLDLVEINPLAINTAGQIMALNGQVRVNERAINRHPEIAKMANKMVGRSHFANGNGNLDTLEHLEQDGQIAILGNGTGSVLTTLDLVTYAGGQISTALNLRHSFLTDTLPTTFGDRLAKSLKTLANDKNTQVILMNFLGTVPQASEALDIISKFLELDTTTQTNISRSNGNRIRYEEHFPRLVLRLAGSDFNSYKKHLATLKTAKDTLIIVENLDEAVTEAVRLAKLPGYRK